MKYISDLSIFVIRPEAFPKILAAGRAAPPWLAAPPPGRRLMLLLPTSLGYRARDQGRGWPATAKRRATAGAFKAAGDSSLAAEPRDPSCPLLPGRARARSEGPPPPLPLQVPVVRERRDEREFWPDLRVEKR